MSPLVSIKEHESFFLLKFVSQDLMKAFLVETQRGSFLDRLSSSVGNIWESVLFENVFDLLLFQDEVAKLPERQLRTSSGSLTENCTKLETIQSSAHDTALQQSQRISSRSHFDEDIIETNGDPKANKIRNKFYRVKHYINYKI